MKKTLLILALSALSAVAFAQGGGQAMPFLAIERSPAVMATGSAGFSAAWSAFGNAACMPFLAGKMDAEASWQNWAPRGAGSSNIGAGAAFMLSDALGMSVAFARQGGEEYEITDVSGVSKGSFKPSDMIFGAGMGFRLGEKLSAGASVRFAREKLSSDDSYSALAASADIMYASGGLKASAGIHNAGSSVTAADGTKYQLPASVNVSGAYVHGLGDAGGISASVAADYFPGGGFTAGLGAEFSFRDMLFVRAGYHAATQAAVLPSFAALGLGAKFAGARLDLAYLFGNASLGGTLALALGYGF